MSKIYFGIETENAIKDYLKSKDLAEKQKIYLIRIRPAFDKLTENIINMPKFDFKKMDSFQSLHNEVMSHLYSVLEKFNPRRLSKKTGKRVKAFSYFGTVAKNYLVQKSIKFDKTDYILEDAEGNEISIDNNIDLSVDSIEDEIEMTEFFQVLIGFFEKNMVTYSDEKKKVADAVVFFLKNSQKENIHNKKHFYLLLKEYTGLSSKQITSILNEFKKDYVRLKTLYYEKYL